MSKQHWNAEKTAYRMDRSHSPVWALVYDPTPEGRKNEDGTTSYELRFPALILAEYVEEPEKVAGEIAGRLNAINAMLDALKVALREIDAEIDQRKHGGNDEHWEDLQKISDAGHAAIAMAEGRALPAPSEQ